MNTGNGRPREGILSTAFHSRSAANNHPRRNGGRCLRLAARSRRVESGPVRPRKVTMRCRPMVSGSLDGTRVAFISDRDGSESNVFTLEWATGRITQVPVL